MRLIVIGGRGTIGSEVVKMLAADHEIVTAGRTHGDLRVDISDKASIAAMYAQCGPFDGVVCAAGAARFAAFDGLSDDDFGFSLSNKLMGQVNLVRLGVQAIRDNGSFTLTSGVLSREPMTGSAAISLVNAALEGFACAAALELPRGLRVNIVSPCWVTETLAKLGMPSTGGMPAAKVARAYKASVEGRMTGAILDTRAFK